MTPSKPNHLPKTLPPNTITLGVKASTCEFEGDTSLQSITITNKEKGVNKKISFGRKIFKLRQVEFLNAARNAGTDILCSVRNTSV